VNRVTLEQVKNDQIMTLRLQLLELRRERGLPPQRSSHTNRKKHLTETELSIVRQEIAQLEENNEQAIILPTQEINTVKRMKREKLKIKKRKNRKTVNQILKNNALCAWMHRQMQ